VLLEIVLILICTACIPRLFSLPLSRWVLALLFPLPLHAPFVYHAVIHAVGIDGTIVTVVIIATMSMRVNLASVTVPFSMIIMMIVVVVVIIIVDLKNNQSKSTNA
jgi:hypothetical protein